MNNTNHGGGVFSSIPSPDRELLAKLYRLAFLKMGRCYHPEMGGLTVSDTGSYCGQVWARDVGAGAFGANPEYVRETLRIFLSHQLPSGEIPYRLEADHHAWKYIFGWTRHLGFNVTKRSKPEPIYRHSPYAAKVCDTVPILILTFAGTRQKARLSDDDLLELECLERAVKCDEDQFFDHSLGLFKLPGVSDWMDCVDIAGHRTFTNLLWWRAYRTLAHLHLVAVRRAKERQVRQWHVERATYFKVRAREIYKAIQDNLLRPDGCLRAGVGDDRIDTTSSILYVLFRKDWDGKQRTLTSLESLRTTSGLHRNFDRDFSWSQFRFWFRVVGFTKFANIHVYPWLNHLILLGKIRTMDPTSPESAQKCLRDVMLLAYIHEQNGDFHEVVCAKTGRPAAHHILGLKVFRSTPGFLAAAGTWIAAMDALAERLGTTPGELFGTFPPPSS